MMLYLRIPLPWKTAPKVLNSAKIAKPVGLGIISPPENHLNYGGSARASTTIDLPILALFRTFGAALPITSTRSFSIQLRIAPPSVGAVPRQAIRSTALFLQTIYDSLPGWGLTIIGQLTDYSIRVLTLNANPAMRAHSLPHRAPARMIL